MTLGIFVEGPSDKQSIPILIKKLGYRARLHTRVVSGNRLSARRMSRHVSALLTLPRRPDRILIFIDSEGVEPETTQRNAEPVAIHLNQVSGRIPVDYVVVDHSLEGWLACDEDALRRVLGRQARINTRGNPEDHSRPAELMSRIFRENGKDFRKTVHNQQIAEFIKPGNILAKSPTFRRLASLLGARSSS